MTNRYLRHSSFVVLAWLLISDATAQSPWQVTVTPTMNPLPIGLCGAVQVTVRDAAGTETPRNGLGARMSIADFDMTATAPGKRSVAGQQIDAFHWSVCACTFAAVGSVATVTASYPAQSLPSAARVPGVAFKTNATFVIAPAKGTNPPACTAPPPAPAKPAAAAPPASSNASGANATRATPASAPKPVSAPAPSNPSPNNAKPAAAPSQASTAGTNSQPATTPQQQQQQPPVPAVPDFPDSTADWAALQESLGSNGWAELQKAVDASLNEPLDDADDKPPPGVPAEMMGAGRNHAAAVAAFKTMLPVLRHPRCANCHTEVTYTDYPEQRYSDAPPDPPKATTHKGGDINELPPTAKDKNGDREIRLAPCTDCHTKAPLAWDDRAPNWSQLDDYQLCQQIKNSRFNGDVLLDHLKNDDLIGLAFQGQKAMEGVTPEPPPATRAEFLRRTTEWINRMDGMQKYPKALSEGCPRTDAWSGAIEYTYTEVGKLSKHESHGVVHIVGGLAKWSALAARTEDHSAKNCRDVFSASAEGGGEMQLVTIDYTSENPVTGINMPMPGAVKKPGAAAPTAFVALTIFPGKYSLAIDLPMMGSGINQGGGSACPGYKPYKRPFDSKIGEGAGGKFDPDNPDEISGTMSSTPFPGASITMKWQFMRVNEDRGR